MCRVLHGGHGLNDGARRLDINLLIRRRHRRQDALDEMFDRVKNAAAGTATDQPRMQLHLFRANAKLRAAMRTLRNG